MRLTRHISYRFILFAIVLLAIFTRFFRLGVPNDYVFDEVYHAFTAQEMAKGNLAAWEWWNSPPDSFAYEWTHPPLAKEVMVVGIKAFSWLPGTLERIPNFNGGKPLGKEFAQNGDNPLSWRFPIAVFSVGIVAVLYFLGKEMFSEQVGLIAAFLATFDGLLFVNGRIGMNDTVFLFFQLGVFIMFVRYLKTLSNHKDKEKFKVIRKRSFIYLILTGVLQGLALSAKWTALYGMVILFTIHGVVTFVRSGVKIRKKGLRLLIYDMVLFARETVFFIVVPFLVYLASYIPFFLGHTWTQFIELQKQMWFYHTGLKATHSYQSAALTWPFMMRPVWYFVKYFENGIANIYALGNPAIWWGGLIAIVVAIVINLKVQSLRLELMPRVSKFKAVISSFASNFVKASLDKKSLRDKQGLNLKRLTHNLQPTTNNLLFLLFAYFGFFLPWVFSPRIMFLYHYMPSLTFLILILAFFLDKIMIFGKRAIIFVVFYLSLVLVIFVFFYPHLSALPVSREWAEFYVWFPSWK